MWASLLDSGSSIAGQRGLQSTSGELAASLRNQVSVRFTYHQVFPVCWEPWWIYCHNMLNITCIMAQRYDGCSFLCTIRAHRSLRPRGPIFHWDFSLIYLRSNNCQAEKPSGNIFFAQRRTHLFLSKKNVRRVRSAICAINLRRSVQRRCINRRHLSNEKGEK